jgi:bacterioferritin
MEFAPDGARAGAPERWKLSRNVERRSGGVELTQTTQPEQSAAVPVVTELLTIAYLMELETVANYLAASVNLDGIRAQEVARALAADVEEELDHARRLAERLNQLGAVVPGSRDLIAEQDSLQPTGSSTDVEAVIRGVLEAEKTAIAHYRQLIETTDGVDWVTQDLAISILADEETHRRLLESFLREYEDESG